MKARVKFHQLIFKTPGGTSRGVLKTKDAWFLILEEDGNVGIGECSVIYGLSVETKTLIERKLSILCDSLNSGEIILTDFFSDCPAVRFAYEMAILDLNSKTQNLIYESSFVNGVPIPINGLVWMGTKKYMFDQIKEKLTKGFKCIKIKIAAIDFQEELDLLKYIRSQFSSDEIQIRVDANGGFKINEALSNLKRLTEYDLHSIEQPIKQGLKSEMARLCEESPLAIALDEELIGVDVDLNGEFLLRDINPQYIILKPSLLGGFERSEKWIRLANKFDIKWWITSALESNIGLNAIAQWTSTLNSNMYQGLGTGQLFTNNIPSPLVINDGALHYKGDWDLSLIL